MRPVVACGIVAAIGCGRVVLDGGTGGTGGGGGEGGGAGMAAAGSTGLAGAAGAAGTASSAGSGGAAGDGGADAADVGGSRTMGVVGCSLAISVMARYQRVGGMRMWPPRAQYSCGLPCGNPNDWSTNNSGAWQGFDAQKTLYGAPTDVWIMVCNSVREGATTEEVQQMIANTRAHAPAARIHVTGEPLYNTGWTCLLAGAGGPELTDERARAAASDASLNVTYAGTFILDGNASPTEVASDTCHASAQGELALGNQAVAKWGK
jgi:hypothetical protein